MDVDAAMPKIAAVAVGTVRIMIATPGVVGIGERPRKPEVGRGFGIIWNIGR